ncbi:MAG: MipA/OmpV family protein [Alphaproteobacteria bacterium]
MTSKITLSLLLCSAFMFGAQQAWADNFDRVDYAGEREYKGDKDWDVTLGAGALALPEYEGSDEYEVLPVPYIDASYKDILTFNPFEGLRYNVFREGGITFGPGLGYDFGRDDDEGDRLRGLGDVDGTIEGQVFASYKAGMSSGEITFAHDLGDGHEGYTVEAELGHIIFLSENSAFIRPSISTSYASDNYMSSYFGVNNVQAQNSVNNAFDADAGFKDVSVNVFASMPITNHWSINGLAGYSRLMGDAADSPVTEDKNQLMGGAFAAYRF